MMGVGSAGGGLCSRSITDFATSAAERIVSGDLRARDFGARRAALRAGFGAVVDLRTRGLATATFAAVTFATATGFDARPGATAAAAASIFLRACFAAFFSTLNNFRACLSCAFADRTWSLAATARAAAFAASAFSRFIVAGLVAMRFRAGHAREIDEYRRLPRRRRHAPWGTRATPRSSHAIADSRGISCPASWAPWRPLVHGP
jgi:hypothetical protein